MIAITTSSSMSVNALQLGRRVEYLEFVTLFGFLTGFKPTTEDKKRTY
jgi:hypothetical protein